MEVLLVVSALLMSSGVTFSTRRPDEQEIQRSIYVSRSFHLNDRNDISSQPDPPPKNETARMARYLVHYSDWCVLAHVSRHGNTSGFPAARVYSTADGFINASTGTLYFYVSKMDAHINDLSIDNRCSVTVSLAEAEYCREHSLDAEDPRCAQVILTGNFFFIDPEKKEAQRAKNFLFEKHPVMRSWPEGHKWQVGKIKIGNIQVADNFGGSAYPSVEEYFAATP